MNSNIYHLIYSLDTHCILKDLSRGIQQTSQGCTRLFCFFGTRYAEGRIRRGYSSDAEAAYKALDDQAKADTVITAINSIGAVEYTFKYRVTLNNARNAYNALTDDQKALVTNSEALTLA